MTEQGSTQAPRSPSTLDDDEIDIGHLLAVLWFNKFLIVGCGVIIGIIGVCYALVATPIYQADVLLQVEDGESSAGMIDQDLSMLMGLDQSSSDTEIEILKSRMILGQAAEQVGLSTVVEPVYFPLIGKALVRYGIERPSIAQGWPSVWAGESITLGELTVFDDDILEDMEDDPYLLRVLSSESYELENIDGEVIGQGKVGELVLYGNASLELEVSNISAPANTEFELTKRTYEGATRYLAEEFGVAEQGDETGILRLSLRGESEDEIVNSLDAISQVYLIQNINRQAAEAEQSLAFLEEQTPLIQEDLVESEDRLNEYRMTQESVDLTLETENVLLTLVEVESQLNELELQETEISKSFTKSHPSYRALLEKRTQLSREKARLNALVEDLPETQQEVLRLTRDVEVSQQIYLQVLNVMQELRIAKAGTIGTVRILDNALVAEDIVSPRRMMIVILSGFVGGFLGLGIVFVKMLMTRGITNVDEITALGLPVYATVPLSEHQMQWDDKKKRKSNNMLLAQSHPADLAIEALRSLRTSLHFAMLNANNNRLMLTGSSPSMGKSFISENLAAICAQSGQKVLLIDADLRRGHIHAGFNDGADNGLSELLSKNIDSTVAIRHSNIEGLDYIARGSVPPNPSELLMSQNFSELLETVSGNYDLVLIDTPPILAVTDAAVVGKHVSATLMISRFGVNTTKELERAKEQLEMTGVEVKGAVLNAVDQTAGNYGYYYNYSYQSHS